MARYRLSQQAQAELRQVYLDSVSAFGMNQADRYSAGLKAIFEFLADNPRAARERLDVEPPVRIHPYRAHVVIYTVDDLGVLILRIRHGREDWLEQPV